MREQARRLLTSRVVTALAEPHGVDRYLTLVNPLWSVREVRARVLTAARRTPDTVTMTLRPNGLWAGAKAGQYVRFGVDIDGVRRIRCFSLAGSTANTTLEITAKINPGGTVTRWLATHARPGLLVHLSQAEGEFTLPDAVGPHVLLISGGSGITPVMSIARTLRDTGYPGRVTVLHYARTPDDVVYRAELAQLARSCPRFTVTHRYTSKRRTHFRPQHLRAITPDYADAHAFVCGPAGLLAAVGAHWAEEGISDRLRAERFTVAGAPFRGDPGTVAGELWFSRSGIRVPGDGRTLLEQAEAAGLRPAYGCRMGICNTCGSHKTSGPVRDVRTGVTSAEPDEQVRLCVNSPAGDVEIAI
jgi:stearoyl-CoA 9-desaturase NADPH oxidoreductase